MSPLVKEIRILMKTTNQTSATDGTVEGTALVPYSPRFKFGWGYVADCGELALLIQLKNLNRQFNITIEEVKQVNQALAR